MKRLLLVSTEDGAVIVEQAGSGRFYVKKIKRKEFGIILFHLWLRFSTKSRFDKYNSNLANYGLDQCK